MITNIDILIHQLIHFERGKNYCVEAASGIGKSSLLHFIGGFRTDYEILTDISMKRVIRKTKKK